jgi:hypothetical protein
VIVEVGLARSRIETTVIHDNGPRGEAQNNREAALRLYERLCAISNPASEGASEVWQQIPSELVKSYLLQFDNHRDAERTQTAPVIQYIEDREDERLDKWDVVFVGSSDANASSSRHLPLGLKLQERTPAIKEGGRVIATSRRFSSRGVVRIGMDPSEVARVKQSAEAGGTKNISDSAYLAERKRPLLAVHFLKLLDKDSKAVFSEPPVTAWTIGFPHSERPNMTVSYQVNTVWWKQNTAEIDEEVAEAFDREE